MSDVAIRVEGLSKQYRIGAQSEPYRTLRETLSSTVALPWQILSSWSNSPRSVGRAKEKRADHFWAIKDLSFDVNRGEIVGIIGSNGAGKSTLLKILSRITEPTEGYADLHGRVGSLLEVGSGFHPELTGRENIFLNGAILGMRREEIERKFDEIAAFAEVEKFLDTPVKRYSSGMYLRLAFAVAAHLEPEILIVDEVLAVGDMAFQKKCLGKMGDVAAQGRTVLFVSHNLSAVKELCQTSLVLHQGRASFQGPVVEGLAYYSQLSMENSEGEAGSSSTGWRGLSVNGQTAGRAVVVEAGEDFYVETTINLRSDFTGGRLFFIMNNYAGEIVIHQRVESGALLPKVSAPTRFGIRVELPALWLAPGIYTLYFKLIGFNAAGADERHFSERVILEVVGDASGIGRAALAPPVKWAVQTQNELSANNYSLV